jgi:DNA-binding NarL/FixJ family response regulator
LIRVLVVDDQEAVRAALRGILRERYGFEVVGECDDGSTVDRAVTSTRPDVIVMDLRMPNVDGVAATIALTRRPSSPPVIVLTTFSDDEHLAAALRAGAAGFLLKGGPVEDLQQAVRTVAEGGAWLDPAVTGRVLRTYRSTAPRADETKLEVLTAREREVLALIGQGRSNAEIATEFVVGEGTIKTHVNHVFAKLHLRDRAAAVVIAFDCGLVSPHPEPDHL